MSRSIPPPILLRNHDGHMEHTMICTLCHELPLVPVVTPCSHMFCQSCIQQALYHKAECPNDRKPLNIHSIKPIDGILRRVWENIGVKCPCCDWTGLVGAYQLHFERCPSHAKNPKMIDEVKAKHMREIQSLRAAYNQAMKALNEKHENSLQALKEQYDAKVQQSLALSKAITFLTVANEHDPEYRYDRFRVVELTQVICRNLECKPAKINSNQIFNCIKKIYDDLDRGYSDNPEHYYVDVRMLLNVCRASNWFSQKQRSNFNDWCQNQDWG